MKPYAAHQERWIGVIPIWAAFVVHGLAHANYWGALLASTLTLLGVQRDRGWRVTRLGLGIVAVGGWLAGAALLALGIEPPDRPFPPAIWSGMVGVLLATTTYLTIARRVDWALGLSLGLVILSLNVSLDVPLLLALCVFVASFLASSAALTEVLSVDSRFLTSFAAFVTISTLLTIGVYRLVDRFGGTIDRALGRLFVDGARTHRTGLGLDVTITPKHQLRPTNAPLLELSAPVRRLRANTFDAFDGRRWTSSRETLNRAHVPGEVPRTSGEERRFEMFVLGELHSRIPLPAGTWELRGASITLDGGWVARGEPLGPFLTAVGDRRERLPREPPPVVEPGISDTLRDKLLRLADQLAPADAPPREQARRIEEHFRERHAYSLDTDLTGDDHPLVVLVRDRRPASCSFFAGAMAAILQVRGIPARVVTGYVPTEPNRYTGRTVVRARDAHAWVEVWLEEERRFVPFDPTPWRARDDALGIAEEESRVSALFEAALTGVRRAVTTLWHDPWGTLLHVLGRPWAWPLLLVAVVVLWRRWRRARRPRSRPPRLESDDRRVQRCYADYLDSLRRAGVDGPATECDEELLARLAETRDATVVDAARSFLAEYRRVRYGGAPFREELARQARF